jgi:hypothetical protein
MPTGTCMFKYIHGFTLRSFVSSANVTSANRSQEVLAKFASSFGVCGAHIELHHLEHFRYQVHSGGDTLPQPLGEAEMAGPSDRKYVTLISREGFEYVIKADCACVSNVIKEMLKAGTLGQ